MNFDSYASKYETSVGEGYSNLIVFYPGNFHLKLTRNYEKLRVIECSNAYILGEGENYPGKINGKKIFINKEI